MRRETKSDWLSHQYWILVDCQISSQESFFVNGSTCEYGDQRDLSLEQGAHLGA